MGGELCEFYLVAHGSRENDFLGYDPTGDQAMLGGYDLCSSTPLYLVCISHFKSRMSC